MSKEAHPRVPVVDDGVAVEPDVVIKELVSITGATIDPNLYIHGHPYITQMRVAAILSNKTVLLRET